MGAAFYISLEREIPGLDTMVDGKSLSRASEALENLAGTLKVRPLMEFFSIDAGEMTDVLGDDIDLPSDGPSKQFHEAKEGLKTVRALIAACSKSPATLKNADRVLIDLKEFERILSKADEAGVKWSLSIDV